ncbi:2,5-diamino-6-(ribosylamino)-4(3H)-pyrimidinone 5'-phosphate reductase [Pelolinea submarina]|nr:2,5-diamino-6-(ribosylamino)-4(3H)-pyrimidinone 5'-phosphate reductase [Pelolinea submarina]
MHTQISLDGCIRGFQDTGIYYLLANNFNSDMVLFGSETVLMAAEQFPPETEKSFVKPEVKEGDTRQNWVIPDSRGRLRNLHVFRDTPYCKDIILLVSQATPKAYLEYLKERNYDFILAGEDHVDYRRAFELLNERYGCKVLRTDSGGMLTNVLLQQGLVDEISLVVSPCLVGQSSPNVFRSLNLENNVDLEWLRSDALEGGFVHLMYRVIGQA